MKKLILLPVFFLCLSMTGMTSMAGASGTSMAVLVDDGGTGGIFLAKFRSGDFLSSEVDDMADQLSQAIQAYGYGSNAWVFNHSQLGDPDSLRNNLTQFYNAYEVIFLEFSKGAAPVASAQKDNIWMDMSYDNWGKTYIGTFGFQEWLTQMNLN